MERLLFSPRRDSTAGISANAESAPAAADDTAKAAKLFILSFSLRQYDYIIIVLTVNTTSGFIPLLLTPT